MTKPAVPDWFLPIGSELWYVDVDQYHGTARLRRITIERHRPSTRARQRNLYSCRADDGEAVPLYVWRNGPMLTKRGDSTVYTDQETALATANAEWQRRKAAAESILLHLNHAG